ncbi:MAG: transketolase [Myxococcota bacterium]
MTSSNWQFDRDREWKAKAAEQEKKCRGVGDEAIQRLAVNTLRTLAIDAVQQANSGHPGAPMGMAPAAYCLWQDVMRYDPAHPCWPNRDRFVLSNGHASMLLYALLHVCNVRRDDGDKGGEDRPVTLEEIQRFRQLGSRAPGHPEFGMTTGVEMTTGPLGQGVATSVGMALAGKWLGRYFNRPGYTLFDHKIYAMCGDGCLMEGITFEALSLAAHLRLDNLCWIYDCNQISIEGDTRLAWSEEVQHRFNACGWGAIHVNSGDDLRTMRGALHTGHEGRPQLILVHTRIGEGAPTRAGTAKAHGEPLGEEEVRGAKQAYGWPGDATFHVPPEVYQHFQDGIGKRGARLYGAWQGQLAGYDKEHPALAKELHQVLNGELPEGWDADLPAFTDAIATRAASGKVLNALAARIPWMVGGSADLAPSTKTWLDFQGAGVVTGPRKPDPMFISQPGRFFCSEHPYTGQNMHFGVREHAMATVMNGMALQGLRPFGGTFLVFSDYARPAIRLAALMQQPVVYVFTHDSIGLGQDGPTHQPIEHLAALRAMPGLLVLRPADGEETRACWRIALRCKGPVALALSRQTLPILTRSASIDLEEGVGKGAYVLSCHPERRDNDAKDLPDPAQRGEVLPRCARQDDREKAILIGTGSEVHLCVQAQQRLAQEGIPVRVVSMPCWELFAEQKQEYRDSVLPPALTARVAVEAASSFGWERWVGSGGAVVGIDRFGASAPASDLYKHFGITVDRIVAKLKEQLTDE